MQAGSGKWQQAAVCRGHNRAHLISLGAFQYAMILNTLEKRALGGFLGEEPHHMLLASDKVKGTLEGTKASLLASLQVGTGACSVLQVHAAPVALSGNSRLTPWLQQGAHGSLAAHSRGSRQH